MKFDQSKITYFAGEEQFPFFFSDHLMGVVNNFSEILTNGTRVNIYPDATVKPNGLPNGIACLAKPDAALLAPYILRDPGCGYLIFKLEFHETVKPDWYQAAGKLLEELVNQKLQGPNAQPKKTINISEIINKGLHAFNLEKSELNCFANQPLSIDTDIVKPTIEEENILLEGFQKVTNTVEIRKIFDVQDSEALNHCKLAENEFIGFIHSGSHVFPKILKQRLDYDIGEYAYVSKLATLDQLGQGIYGVPLEHDLGQKYNQWLRAAMNYAVASRFTIYQAIKQELETAFPCQLTLLNDSSHAGIFEKNINDETIICTSRGVQDISYNTVNLLAGQRETIAALVTAGEKAQDYQGLFAHGTSYHIRSNYEYAQHFTQDEINTYNDLAKNTFYNSQPKYEECLPYTFNLLASLDYFNRIGLLQTAAFLTPLINIQSEWLKKY